MLGGHNVISATIGLARNDRDLWHCRLGKGEQQLGAMLDYAVMFLTNAGQEAGNINKGDDWDIECRSEEHTSELQSLMRISYAVFCLKKKTTYKNIYKTQTNI